MSFHSLFFLCQKQKKLNPKFSQNLVHEIVEKVKYNIPSPNLKLFENDFFGVRLPVFVEHAKNITLAYAKSLFLAGLVFPFELVVFYENQKEILPLKSILKNARFLNKNYLTRNLKSKIYSLNINLPLQSFDADSTSKIFVNNQEINYKEYEFLDVQEIYFSGHFLFCENKQKDKKVNYLIKKIIKLNKNNYFLLKNDKNYYFFNLLTKEKFFVKCTEKVNVQLKKDKTGKNLVVSFCVRASQDFSLYVGKENINIFDKNLKAKILFLKEKSFQNKISAKNKSLEKFFNYILPKKIQEKKLEGFLSHDLKEEKLYFKVKNKIIRFEKNGVSFQKSLAVKSYQTTFCGKNKIINFFDGEKKLVVDGQSFYGVKSVDFKMFKKFNRFDVYG